MLFSYVECDTIRVSRTTARHAHTCRRKNILFLLLRAPSFTLGYISHFNLIVTWLWIAYSDWHLLELDKNRTPSVSSRPIRRDDWLSTEIGDLSLLFFFKMDEHHARQLLPEVLYWYNSYKNTTLDLTKEMDIFSFWRFKSSGLCIIQRANETIVTLKSRPQQSSASAASIWR